MTSDHMLMTRSMGLLPSVGRERTNEHYVEYIEIQNNARRVVCHFSLRKNVPRLRRDSQDRCDNPFHGSGYSGLVCQSGIPVG
jgi:hypothetical protein